MIENYSEPIGEPYTEDWHTNEHMMFGSILANVKLDAELGFLCGADELEVLHDYAVRMATHSPRGEHWEWLGRVVFDVIEAQRAGDLPLADELVDEYSRARIALGHSLPDEPIAVVTFPGSGDEESEGEDIATVEGGYTWHTDGRGPEALQD